ncbi:MAG: hypothetical protein VZR28_10065 [Candidatus Cryptobacteroides sp.]|nr:hypothetical protein [Candidatus Cryptobacteroides sp.]
MLTNFSLMTIVAPHAGAWIEIRRLQTTHLLLPVAPHAGAWIEIATLLMYSAMSMSPLTQGRGLK